MGTPSSATSRPRATNLQVVRATLRYERVLAAIRAAVLAVGRRFVSTADIARQTGMTKGTLRPILIALEREGLIVVSRTSADPDVERTMNRYAVTRRGRHLAKGGGRCARCGGEAVMWMEGERICERCLVPTLREDIAESRAAFYARLRAMASPLGWDSYA
jgi:predicted ArsR family transcriptional regulator